MHSGSYTPVGNNCNAMIIMIFKNKERTCAVWSMSPTRQPTQKHGAAHCRFASPRDGSSPRLQQIVQTSTIEPTPLRALWTEEK